ncbi:MAG: Hpt domain-containing protein, partial [Bdellovibrionales bacterium]|nr:Hpt domain-containing protein [Bdellovibrionales bacterium]
LFTMPTGTKGQNEIYPLSEINYYLPNEENKSGKVQISIYPFSEQDKNLWIILIRDVTVENILHEKHKKQLEQLEQYSKNLEKMVEERTLELKKANNLLNAIMNSLGQGFLVFDEQGVCLDVYTKACEEVLEAKPAGKNIIKVLNCTDNDKEQFEMWLKAIFSEALPFESLKDLGPNEYKHSKGKFITLDFFALYNDDNKISNLVLVATDKTAEREANLALERERAYASMIIKFVTNRKLFSNFVHSLPQTIDYLRQQIESPTVDVNEVFRKIHTLEGEAASLSVMPILDGAKHLQEVITQVRNENNTDFSSVKDDYIFALQELTEAQLAFFKKNEDLLEMLNISHESEFIEVDPKKIKKFYNLFVQAGVDPKLNQQFLEEFTHISLRDELKSANLILEQIAKKQSKNVNPIHFSGEDIYVDHEHFKELLASLVHVFRNIIDHGIELPEERVDL